MMIGLYELNLSGRREGERSEPRSLGAGSLWGLPPRAPTEPGVRISRTRFVTSWLRCPSHGQAVSR